MNPKEAITVPAMPRVISRGRIPTLRDITNIEIQEKKKEATAKRGRYSFVFGRDQRSER